MSSRSGLEIAIIGMAGRFPMAENVEEFWRNLHAGKECMTSLDDQSLLAQGVRREILERPNYVKSSGVMAGEDLFDAKFFEINPREAEILDPQQRVFLECCWTALESAGYRTGGAVVGVYAGAGANTYRIGNLHSNLAALRNVDPFLIKISSDGDFLATRVCYKLKLAGPGLTIQTACSTSLVAIHLASQGLLSGACDMALAGGVGIRIPQRVGFLYHQDHILSPDGHCRAFDALAQGTTGGNGVGVVVLKRLEDALADRDHIRAVIKGSAINNDGANKVGFTAPSIDGQASVIRAAQLMAEVEPESVTYVEAHGTGTPLGDPIEVAALTKAFRAGTDRRQFCAIGSVKTNIGHLDAAAGVAGLIKTVLALEHRAIPASLHFQTANPKIDFAASPFFVCGELRDWEANGSPRRAGVSSFGIGGTNAHLVLEEAPPREPAGGSRAAQLLVLSAKSAAALEAMTDGLAEHLTTHPELDLADAAFTLQVGRQAMAVRRTLVCRTAGEAAAALVRRDPAVLHGGTAGDAERAVVYMFPGQGSQYVGMGRELYDGEPTFRAVVDRCCDLLQPHLGLDLRGVLYPPAAGRQEAERQLQQTALSQPALFTVEYALSGLWLEWGLKPQAMIGHSVGEYVAACLSGVFTLEEGLALVSARGRLIQGLPGGSMLSVAMPEAEIVALLGPELALAAVNAPGLCAVSGPDAAIAELERQLRERGVEAQRLHTSHAFHSAVLDPILNAFAREVEKVKLCPPKVPYLSNLTGTWIAVEQAISPRYWVDQMRGTVRFAAGTAELLREPRRVYLEVGPGRTLTTFLQQAAGAAAAGTTTAEDQAARPVAQLSLRHPKDPQADVELLCASLARLWLAGAQVDWAAYHGHHRRQRVPLPTYPFDRQRFWVERLPPAAAGGGPAPGKRPQLDDWLYVPSWQRSWESPGLPPAAAPPQRWLLLSSGGELEREVAAALTQLGQEVVTVAAGDAWAAPDRGSFAIDPRRPDDYRRLLAELRQQERLPHQILHFWTRAAAAAAAAPGQPADAAAVAAAELHAFHSLLYLAQALGDKELAAPVRLAIVTSGLCDVLGGEPLVPENALLLGPCRVIPQELEKVSCRAVDVIHGAGQDADRRSAWQIVGELTLPPFAAAADQVVAYRGRHRWVEAFVPAPLDASHDGTRRLRQGGVYLVTGGLGGIGAALAEQLASSVGARLVLTGRRALPERAEWQEWLERHGADDPVAVRIRRVLEIERRGGEVLAVSADVTNREDMQALLALTRERFGGLHGVIHAAGVPAGGILQYKTADAARPVLAPKVAGTRILGELLSGVELDCFVLCSSLASVLGGLGQIDYVAANAYQDAYARAWSAATGRPMLAINWDTWSEAGMAVEVGRQGGAPAAAQSFRQVDHPLLDSCVLESGDWEVYSKEFRLERDWVLREHRIQGQSLLPGTGFLELACAVFAGHRQAGGFEISDVALMAPFLAPDDAAAGKELRVTLNREEAGFHFAMSSRQEAGSDPEAPWTQHAKGLLAESAAAPPAAADLAAIRRRCNLQEIVFDDSSPQRHGPHWRCVRRVLLGQDEMLAELALPPAFAGEVERFTLHPSLMDAATSFFVRDLEGAEYLPVGYGRLRILRPLTAAVWSHVKTPAGQRFGQEVLTFDVTIHGEGGETLVTVSDYTLKRVDKAAERLRQAAEQVRAEAHAPGPEPAPPAPRPAAAVAVTLPPARPPALLGDRLELGLLTQEGVEVFKRILDRPAWAQVLVSTEALPVAMERVRSTTLAKLTASIQQAQALPPRYARPEVHSEYVAPRTETERVLAGIWAELLGIDRLGIHDNFFELGGHSLLGIQMVSRLRVALRVDFSVGLIFEHPTVAQLAEVISKMGVLGAEAVQEIRREDRNELDELAVRVDELSESEVDALLLEVMSEADLAR